MSDSSGEKKKPSGSLRQFRFDKDTKKDKKGQASIKSFFSKGKADDGSKTSSDSSQESGDANSPESNVATKTLLSKPSTTISFRQTISKTSENGSSKDATEKSETKVESKLDSKSESSTNGSVSPSGSSPAMRKHTTIIQKPSCTVRMSSKPLFVQPLTAEEEAAHASQTASQKGNDDSVKDTINNSPESRLNSSQISVDDSPIIRAKVVKRLRIDSDDSDDETLEPPNKKSQPNGYNRGEDPAKDNNIDKYLSMWEKLYPMVDMMEQQDIYSRNDWEARQTMVEIGALNDERKQKDKTDRLEKLMKMRENQLAERERIKQDQLDGRERQKHEREQNKQDAKEQAKTEKENKRLEAKKEIKQKAANWKAKGNRGGGRQVEEYEEEEEDYNVGSAKVYDSSDSEEDDDNELTPERQIVLNFFNEGTLSELSAISSCTKKKADMIMEIRPFKDWEHIVKKFRTEKHVSTDLLNEAKNVLNMRCTVKNLLKRCQNIATDMQDIVNRIISGEEDAGISKQPELLNPDLRLKGYQLIGLNWMVLMHQQQLNGVLADEMGLGKTIQAIAFLAYLKEVEDSTLMSVIIVPSSVLDNWYRELQLWCPDLQVLLYHGSQEERRGIRLGIINDDLDMEPDVILTTYNMVTGATEDRALFKKLRFNAIILDEAHMLKNMNSQRYENLMKIKGKRRILLTGTPLQNNLLELMSILIFVMPSLFEGKKDQLKQVFSMFPKSQDGTGGGKGRFEKERIEQAKRIMKPFFLRRLKVDVLKDLPEKKGEVITCKMAEDQQKLYNETVSALSKRAKKMGEERLKATADVNELEQLQEEANKAILSPVKGGGSKSPIKLKEMNRERDSSGNMIMTLRKICNHPLLVRNLYSQKKINDIAKILKKSTHTDSVLEYIIEDLSVMSDFEIHQLVLQYKRVEHLRLTDEQLICSGKFQQLDKCLPELKENGSRVLIFSQFVIMLNIMEKYLDYHGYRFLRLDGSTPVHERQFMIDEFNDDEEIFIFLLSTRAGGLGINLTAANTVILHDIDFNPYNDKQAEDRCHRVGQTRPVSVKRLISAGSIDEAMMSIAQEKLHLEREVTGLEEDEKLQKTDMVNLLKQALLINTDDETVGGEESTEATSNNNDEQEENEEEEEEDDE